MFAILIESRNDIKINFFTLIFTNFHLINFLNRTISLFAVSNNIYFFKVWIGIIKNRCWAYIETVNYLKVFMHLLFTKFKILINDFDHIYLLETYRYCNGIVQLLRKSPVLTLFSTAFCLNCFAIIWSKPPYQEID